MTIYTNAGIVGRRKEGASVFYSIADPTIFGLCDHVCGSIQRHITQHAKAFGGTPPKLR